MKKLVVFGDSFVNYDWVFKETEKLSWCYFLSKKLSIPMINFGISGSGLNYSMIKFVEYLNSNDYDKQDIIVWALTNEQRLFSWSMPDPSMGIFYNLLDSLKYRSIEEVKWITKNKDHALWAMEKIYHPSINYSIIKILSFLKCWADNNLSNNVIVLKCFQTLLGGEKISSLLNIIEPSTNFFPIIDEPLSLVSSQEFSNSSLHEYMLNQNKKFPGLDYRVNHLSTINRLILSKKIFDVLNYKSVNCWKGSKFSRNIYKTTEDIDRINKKFF